ncbi:MAG: hypothetical protein AAGB18_01320 [Pseudomonadota bacterium]
MVLRRFFSVLCPLLLWGGIAMSQNAETEVVIPSDLPQPAEFAKRVWDDFKSECGLAFSDPQAFLQSVPDPDQKGKQSIAASKDGQALKLYKVPPGSKVNTEVYILGVEDGLFVQCASYYLDQDATSAFYSNSEWSNPSSANYLAYVRANETALRQYIGSDTDAPVSGGVFELRNSVSGESSYFPISGWLSLTTEIGGVRLPVVVEFAAIGGGVLGRYVLPHD